LDVILEIEKSFFLIAILVFLKRGHPQRQDVQENVPVVFLRMEGHHLFLHHPVGQP
jgi:hypothetical protein